MFKQNNKEKTNQDQSKHQQRFWQVNRVFKALDRFGIDIPAFNINGEKKVNTFLGGALTFALLCIILLFAAIKF